MRSRPFFTVDVFTPTPCQGNPLAVVMDAGDLSDAQMQQFAHWVNLSETTFLTAPSAEGAAKGADYRVRIFTPSGELPFAEHSTLGSCYVWLEQQVQQPVNKEFVCFDSAHSIDANFFRRLMSIVSRVGCLFRFHAFNFMNLFLIHK